MIAFNYVDKFDELAVLSEIKKLEVLELAHRRALKTWKNLFNGVICLALGLVIGIAPRVFVQIPWVLEGLLLGLAAIVGAQCYRRLYARLLHEKVKELFCEKYTEASDQSLS